jgi:Arc/MetJ-type ribon-helix-helix transcriptional regulator
LAEEMTTYRGHLPELLGDHEGQFVLIKGTEIAGIFPDRSAALREGYRRFGVVPLLVRQIAASDPSVYLPNVALSDDIQRLLRRKVESGQFPSEEAVVEEALRSFLIEEPDKEHPGASCVTEVQEERLPGPFIEDQTVVAPADFPRTGREVACLYLRDITRQPALFPGE